MSFMALPFSLARTLGRRGRETKQNSANLQIIEKRYLNI
jgi:hypothetical protein